MDSCMNKVVKFHPCYSKEAHYKYARLHLPVAKNCNLGCNYCERKIGGKTYHGYRPGCAKKIITPVEAYQEVLSLSKVSNLKVVGIAGPGEPLYNQETFETLELIKNDFPDLIFCISTNGILLSKYLDILINLNILSVSVTINSFDITTLQKIYNYVYTDKGNYLFSENSAQYILKNQIAGIKSLVESKISFKINTIMIPGINDAEIENMAEQLKDMGVKLHNIVPFIPLGRLKDHPATECNDLKAIRDKCEKHIPQFRLCKQCSSDAFDIPGNVSHKSCTI